MHLASKWTVLEEFDGYLINREGIVVNRDTLKEIKQSRNLAGIVKVNLYKEGRWYTRSVRLLVAQTFVKVPRGYRPEIFNTPINLNGDPLDNRAENIVWRSRAFACMYTRQIHEGHYQANQGPIMDLSTGEIYATYWEAALTFGLLVDDIFYSVQIGRPTFPTRQVFTKPPKSDN